MPTSLPRIAGGDDSEMYRGTRALADPTPYTLWISVIEHSMQAAALTTPPIALPA